MSAQSYHVTRAARWLDRQARARDTRGVWEADTLAARAHLPPALKQGLRSVSLTRAWFCHARRYGAPALAVGERRRAGWLAIIDGRPLDWFPTWQGATAAVERAAARACGTEIERVAHHLHILGLTKAEEWLARGMPADDPVIEFAGALATAFGTLLPLRGFYQGRTQPVADLIRGNTELGRRIKPILTRIEIGERRAGHIA